MLEKIQETIAQNQLFLPTHKLLVAVSGGADSMILAYILTKQAYNISIIHCNFQLRGEESDAEEEHVKTFAEKNNLPFFCKKLDTHAIVEATNESIQVVARNLRYTFFEEIMAKENYDFCALAHHADDQAETLFMSLLKGNSPQIWKAIPIKRGKYVRPLLHIRKAEILEMAAQINLPFCTDSSNLKNDYSRNFTRNVVFPALSQLNVAFVNHLLAKNDLYTQQTDFIHLLLQKYISAENELYFAPFVQDLGKDFLPLLIRFFCQKKAISGYLIQEICDLQDSISGKYVNISGGKMLRTRTGLAFISAKKESISPQSYALQQGDTSIFWGEYQLIFTFPLAEKVDFSATKNGEVFYIDTEKTLFPLQIRSYQEGDKMMPLGMHNYKKISDIMIDKKYTFQQKQTAFVITDATGEIIALSGFRVSEKVKMQENSRAILKVCVLAI